MRQDHEYVRGGLCCAFPAFEPLRAWRRAWVRPRRRKLEFAEVVRLVCDNLNTHTPAAFHERYPPEEARRLAARVELIHTPVHGSWLNVVECEFSAMVRQCLGHRRLGEIGALRREIEAWVAARNAAGATVEWQFTTADARVKLSRLYPSVTA